MIVLLVSPFEPGRTKKHFENEDLKMHKKIAQMAEKYPQNSQKCTK